MLWVALGLAALLVLFGIARARRMGPLFADAHLAEIAAKIPDLRAEALSSPPERPAALRTSALILAYSIRKDDGVFTHHLSVSNPITPARAAGTFFLGLARGLLRLEAYPEEAFVSENNVFHLVTQLSDDQQQAFAETPVEPRSPAELRALAIAGRSALLGKLEERAVSLPAGAAP